MNNNQAMIRKLRTYASLQRIAFAQNNTEVSMLINLLHGAYNAKQTALLSNTLCFDKIPTDTSVQAVKGFKDKNTAVWYNQHNNKVRTILNDAVVITCETNINALMQSINEFHNHRKDLVIYHVSEDLLFNLVNELFEITPDVYALETNKGVVIGSLSEFVNICHIANQVKLENCWLHDRKEQEPNEYSVYLDNTFCFIREGINELYGFRFGGVDMAVKEYYKTDLNHFANHLIPTSIITAFCSLFDVSKVALKTTRKGVDTLVYVYPNDFEDFKELKKYSYKLNKRDAEKRGVRIRRKASNYIHLAKGQNSTSIEFSYHTPCLAWLGGYRIAYSEAWHSATTKRQLSIRDSDKYVMHVFRD